MHSMEATEPREMTLDPMQTMKIKERATSLAQALIVAAMTMESNLIQAPRTWASQVMVTARKNATELSTQVGDHNKS